MAATKGIDFSNPVITGAKMILSKAVYLISLAIWCSSPPAMAAGELQIYNWGEYTNPALIKKFEQTYDIKVTLTEYDSNDTALAKIRAGGHGFDIVVPSAHYVPIWISEGLLLETRPDQMKNFNNMDSRWINVNWDPGRHYTVPWQWGTIGVVVDTTVYSGDPNTWRILFDPPAELKGKLNVVPEMGDVMAAAILYNGGSVCTGDNQILRKARDTLVSAKQYWASMDYGFLTKLQTGDLAGSFTWNGAALRARLFRPSFVYGYPREGYTIWMDNVAVLKDAHNVDNAKLFQDFIMAPENAALISSYARYSNGIKGSDKYMPADMKHALEIEIPREFANKGIFQFRCAPEVLDKYTQIWTEILK